MLHIDNVITYPKTYHITMSYQAVNTITTYLEVIDNDGVVLLYVVHPGELGRFSIIQFAVVNVGDILPLLDLVEILVQTVHQERQEFL